MQPEHRCQFITLKAAENPCGKIARCKYGDVWFCSEHYDRIVNALGPEMYIGVDLSLGQDYTSFRKTYGGA